MIDAEPQVVATTGTTSWHARCSVVRIMKISDLQTSLIISEQTIIAEIKDRRSDTMMIFEQLDESARCQLAQDAWLVGLRAIGNARAQAQEARLADVSRTLLED